MNGIEQPTPIKIFAQRDCHCCRQLIVELERSAIAHELRWVEDAHSNPAIEQVVYGTLLLAAGYAPDTAGALKQDSVPVVNRVA